MTIPIFKLPYLAWREIVQSMPIPEAFALSLASQKAARLVKISLQYRKPMIMDIVIDGGASHVKLFEENKTAPVIVWRLGRFSPKYIKRQKLWDVKGMKVMYWKNSSGSFKSDFFASSSRSMDDKNFNKIITHMMDIFPKVKVNKLEIECSSISNLYLPNMISCVKSAVHVSMGDYDFRNYTKYVLENVEISGSFTSTRSVNNGGLIQDKLSSGIDKIQCDNGTWMRAETLLSLNCSTMFLQKTKFDKTTLTDFLRSWTSSDDKKKIQHWRFDCPLGVIPISLEEFGGANWDPAVRPQYYNNDVDCSDGIDIRRADGLLATVVQSFANRFEFVVWHDL